MIPIYDSMDTTIMDSSKIYVLSYRTIALTADPIPLQCREYELKSV
ncbi:hypothetical protein [Aquimarina hainanensis]